MIEALGALHPLWPLAGGAGAVAALWLLARLLAPRHGGALDGIARDTAELSRAQERMIGALTQVTEAQVAAQARMAELVETRLEQVQHRMGRDTAASAARTAESLGALTARLDAIDAAQGRLEKLSDEMLGLQAILSNKQARGAFGEVQLAEILGHALPPDLYALQPTLSNGRRPDALIRLPDPPGPLCIDAKFPLEAFEALRAAETEDARKKASRALAGAVDGHLRAIAERYILEGETADQALMFVPSEAVYAELHANFGQVVRAGFALRVWLVSPTTAMAVLTTLRSVARDARLREETVRLSRELGLLSRDVARLADRAEALDRHFRHAARDLESLRRDAGRAATRAGRIEALDFSETDREETGDRAAAS